MNVNQRQWIHGAREEAEERLGKDQGYQEQVSKYRQLAEKVTAALPEDQRGLLMELNDAAASVRALFETELYFVAIYHGLELAKFLEHPTALASRPAFKSDYEMSAEVIMAEALMSVREDQLVSAVHSDKKRLQERERANGFYAKLKAKLPTEYEKLLMQWEDALNCTESETNRIYYTEGLRQGRELVHFFTSRSLDIRETNCSGRQRRFTEHVARVQ